MIDALLKFVETYTEMFIQHGYPGDPVRIFEELVKISAYVRDNGYKSEDNNLKTWKEFC